MACALDVFAGPGAEVESQLGQVGDVTGLWVRGGGSCGHDGLDDVQGGGFFPIYWRIFDRMSFELAGETPVQADVSLGAGGFLGSYRPSRNLVPAIAPHA